VPSPAALAYWIGADAHLREVVVAGAVREPGGAH
jgi:hypothetical protein